MNVENYSGWRPRSMRFAKKSSETGSHREAKRTRLGNAADRALYKSARGHKVNPTRYGQLCEKADSLNGRK